MGRNGWIVTLLLATAVVGLGLLFAVQNGGRQTQLSLDLGVAAWQLQQPLAVPVLIAVCFGTGVVTGAALMGVRAMRQGSRVRRLEQELAVNSAVTGDRDDGWR